MFRGGILGAFLASFPFILAFWAFILALFCAFLPFEASFPFLLAFWGFISVLWKCFWPFGP